MPQTISSYFFPVLVAVVFHMIYSKKNPIILIAANAEFSVV